MRNGPFAENFDQRCAYPRHHDELVPLLRVQIPPQPESQITSFKDLDWPQIDARVRAVLTDEQLALFRTTELVTRLAVTRFAINIREFR